MKASVDADSCAGHGDCVSTCPAVFTLADAGYAEVIVSEIGPESIDLVRKAVAECPEHAIILE